MPRIVHISDLHFGRTRPELLGPLLAAINRLEPDLLAISGDLTQRARAAQFAEARALIDRVKAPVLCVPGNHDVPLHNLPERLILPFRRYQRWIGRDLEPVFDGRGMLVLGMNTTDPYAWQRGIIRPASLERVAARLTAAGPGKLRVVVMHHPLAHPPGSHKEPMKGAEGGAEALAAAGADIVLAGHLHAWGAAPVTARGGGRATLFVQAGTGLSTRLRGEENDFNLIETDGSAGVVVTRHRALADASDFIPLTGVRFVRSAAAGWQNVA